MTVYEQARPEDREEIIDFINMVFSVAHQPHNFKELLPKVYADGAPLYDQTAHFVERTSGRIRACVAMLPVPMIVAGVELTWGYVGSVSAHPYHRGQGSMKHLMRMAAEEAAARGYTGMALGGQRQRYEYFRFSPAGSLASYEIRASNVRHALKDTDCSGLAFSRVEDGGDELVAPILALHDAQPAHALRPKDLYLAICRSWTRGLYAVLDGGKCIGGIVASGKGEMSELLLESAADAPRVIKAWMEENRQNEITLSIPARDAAVNRAVGAFAESVSLHEECSIDILNWADTLRAYTALKALSRPMSDGRWTFVVEGLPSITISVRGGLADVGEAGEAPDARFTHLEAQRAIFSQMTLLDPVPGAPLDWFPLPLGFPKADMF